VPERPCQILLKARPIALQLADRLAEPVPDGIELYIHEQDVSGDDWLERLEGQFQLAQVPPDFTWIVEGPVWALDGELFGLCRNAAIDQELTRRLVRLAAHLGARAVNIHCVEGSPDPAVLTRVSRAQAMERSMPFLQWFVHLCQNEGVIPLIENVPPICRMRRAAFIYTPIGVEPQDLLMLVQDLPGLGITLDTSHAQLAINAFRGGAPEEKQEPALAPAARYYRELGGPATLAQYVGPLLPWIVSAHISNAAGLLEEGLPYEQGDADLDAAIRQLAQSARFFVTEPLDPDEDHAVLKREIQAHLRRVLDECARPAAPVDRGAIVSQRPS
jgi:hypothetical protein